jgi:hypothetical protein
MNRGIPQQGVCLLSTIDNLPIVRNIRQYRAQHHFGRRLQSTNSIDRHQARAPTFSGREEIFSLRLKRDFNDQVAVLDKVRDLGNQDLPVEIDVRLRKEGSDLCRSLQIRQRANT